MKEDLIIFEKFPGEKNNYNSSNSFMKKNSKIIFIGLLSVLLILLFFISSLANKKILDAKESAYYEKI